MKNLNILCVEKPTSGVAAAEELSCIYVGAFDDTAAEKFHAGIMKLEANPDVKVIPVIINSYGGSVYSLFAMLDVLSSTTKPVATIAVGKAMSCGSVLLAAGTPGYRYCGNNADVMIHEVGSWAVGKTTELKADVKNTDRLNDILLNKLASFCGKDKNYFQKKIKEHTNLDWYLDAKTCKKLGLVDHVGTPKLLKK